MRQLAKSILVKPYLNVPRKRLLDGHHVKAAGNGASFLPAKKLFCRAEQEAALLRRNRLLRGARQAARAGLDLDKSQHRPIPADQINFARDARQAKISP